MDLPVTNSVIKIYEQSKTSIIVDQTSICQLQSLYHVMLKGVNEWMVLVSVRIGTKETHEILHCL